MRALVLLSIPFFVACASGGTRAGEAPAPSTQTAGPADECGGLYALDARNEGDDEVWFAFSDLKQLQPAREIGVLRGRDATTFFFRFSGTPLVWAWRRDGNRVYLNDRTGEQRYRIRMNLRCDTP